eukprot:3145771-Amphidinium_carterae.1
MPGDRSQPYYTQSSSSSSSSDTSSSSSPSSSSTGLNMHDEEVRDHVGQEWGFRRTRHCDPDGHLSEPQGTWRKQ